MFSAKIIDINAMLKPSRETALSWYPGVYRAESYKMGDMRRAWAESLLDDLPRGSYFDVGAGRGEMVAYASRIGFNPARGCEVVGQLIGGPICHGLAHDLPAGRDEYDVVTMFDVMEHLIEQDCLYALDELKRVAKKHILLSISNTSSIQNGHELHITRKSYDTWHDIIQSKFEGDDVLHMVHPQPCVCEMWRIDLK